MAKESIRIFLICDYSIFQTALRMLIESEPRLKVVGETSLMKMSPEAIRNAVPDLILCDLATLGGKALTQLAVPELADIPVLVMTRNEDVEFYQQCLRLGIKGLLSKQNGADVLFKAIWKVCDGELWFDRSIMGETIRHMLNEKQMLAENPTAQKVNGMTEREKQVIELICKGMKNKSIAEKLFITETTVRHHLTSVFNKLEVGTRLELVIYAFKNHLVKLPVAHTNYDGNGGESRGVH